MKARKSKKPLILLFVLGVFLTWGYGAVIRRYSSPQPASINKIAPVKSITSQPSLTKIQGITQTKMYFNDDKGIMNAEITPWMLGTKKTGGWYTYLTSTYDTFMCTTPNNIFELKTEDRLYDRQNCILRQEPALTPTTFSNPGAIPLWNRDYHGTFSAHLLQHKNSDLYLYSINHSESYNNDSLAIRFPGQSVSPCIPVANMGYGSLPCDPTNWWGSYNAWITLSRMPWTYTTLTTSKKLDDLGPITWPSNGYIESLDNNQTWVKATDGGVRHPSSIVKDNYLYVFYEDLSQGPESSGRGPGIKVIRAPITDNGVDPNSFKAFYKNDFVDSSLPSGFNLPTYYKSLSQKGPRSSSLFPQLTKTAPQATLGSQRKGPRQVGDIISFSVAQVAGTNYYLGVAHELSRGITLRLSQDLVNWSEATVVPETESNWWQGNLDLQKYPLLYPRLANKNGDSNVLIDASEFYIIGTQTKPVNGIDAKVVNSIKLKLAL